MATEPTTPEGIMSTKPCPSINVGILAFDQPTIVHCGLLDGHDGPHRMSIEWTMPDYQTIAQHFPDREVTFTAAEQAKYVAECLTQDRVD